MAKELKTVFSDEVINAFPKDFELNPINALKDRYFIEYAKIDPDYMDEYMKIHEKLNNLTGKLSSLIQPENANLITVVEELFNNLESIMYSIAFRNGLRDGFILARNLFK